MRIEIPREAERIGSNLFYGLQKVYELDSGVSKNANDELRVVERISYETLYDIEEQMAVVVPMKDENLKLLEGVLYGIPHQCLIIIVSNSPREPVDRFALECAAIETYQRFSRKHILIVHQKDPKLSEAFAETGYSEILSKDGIVKNGKAEGMIIGTMLARLAGKKYIGFIDADNYFPGSVHEYVRIYSAGFALSKSKYSMVRISWHSKPKIVESELFFAKWGRTSVITNSFLNRLLTHYTGFETEVIKTGNAGEHAMTLDLAMQLEYSTGYSIEPYHFMNMLERFGGISNNPHEEILKQQIEVFQIESRNPHLHEQKGTEHVEHMIYAALQVIFHSPVTPQAIKDAIFVEMLQRKFVKKNEQPKNASYYPALSKIDLRKFFDIIKNEGYTELMKAREAAK